MMTMTMALAKRRIPWYHVPLNWTIVFFGNLAGALFWDGILVYLSGIFTQPYAAYAITFATTKVVTPSWGQILARGVGCNFLVCLAIWQASASDLVFPLVTCS